MHYCMVCAAGNGSGTLSLDFTFIKITLILNVQCESVKPKTNPKCPTLHLNESLPIEVSQGSGFHIQFSLFGLAITEFPVFQYVYVELLSHTYFLVSFLFFFQVVHDIGKSFFKNWWIIWADPFLLQREMCKQLECSFSGDSLK